MSRVRATAVTAVAVVAAAVVAAGCAAEEPRGGACAGSVSLPIFGGGAQPSYLEAGPELARAVALVRFARDGGEVHCSGLFLARRWVLTARHCGPPGATAEVSIVGDDGELERTIAVARTVAHPSLDLLLIELADEAEVAPVPLAADDPARFVGERAQIAGFGLTDTGSRGGRRFATVLVEGATATTIVTASVGGSGACEGDSGGPLLVRDRTGRVATLGALSRGSPGCNQSDSYVRVDVARGWIAGVIGGAPVLAPESCGQLGVEGRCFAGTAVWCGDDGQVTAVHCEGAATCGHDAARGGVGCVADDPCGGVDALGVCSGSMLLRCEAGRLTELDCGACGVDVCGESSVDGAARCAPPPT